MVSKRIVSRGNVVIPIDGGAPAGMSFYVLVGPHLYLGSNRWFLPSGIVICGQDFHRRFLREIKRGWWKVVS